MAAPASCLARRRASTPGRDSQRFPALLGREGGTAGAIVRSAAAAADRGRLDCFQDLDRMLCRAVEEGLAGLSTKSCGLAGFVSEPVTRACCNSCAQLHPRWHTRYAVGHGMPAGVSERRTRKRGGAVRLAGCRFALRKVL